ncbi:cobalamin biosynthesis protein [Wukongibacter baidiensis]|uniref:GHMP family kinase ATP-binding protein n=1 Tax=Wukongibacter baidiensis TaxID=1723361 RepID=UPI003D7F67C6
MKVKAICPASCGELIQGVIGDGEKLISLPVDVFSEVTLEEKKHGKSNISRPKALLALKKTLEHFKVQDNYIESISIDINSNIPIAKGMASSTADIAATIVATARLLGKEMKPELLGELCCKIEPTDSTIFDKLTLFDHINGRVIGNYDWMPEMKVLVLELEDIVNTQEFRKNDYSVIRYENKKLIEKAHKVFEMSCNKKDRKLLGEVVTLSSMANQRILFKPMLHEIIDISLGQGAYGVNVAHSGTVVGILYDEKRLDIDKLKDLFDQSRITKEYTKAYTVNMIKGGVKII